MSSYLCSFKVCLIFKDEEFLIWIFSLLMKFLDCLCQNIHERPFWSTSISCSHQALDPADRYEKHFWKGGEENDEMFYILRFCSEPVKGLLSLKGKGVRLGISFLLSIDDGSRGAGKRFMLCVVSGQYVIEATLNSNLKVFSFSFNLSSLRTFFTFL